MKKFMPHLFAALAFLVPFAIYLYHLSPTYIPIDSAEFTMCVKFWGLCHPPGFPLYIFVSHILTTVFTFGDLIWRVNLISALFGAATIFLLYLTFLRLKVSWEIAFLVSLFMAVSTSFWEFSLSADVFTFGTFLVILSLYLVFSKRKLLAFFVLGLSASHFYLTAVLWPIYIWYFWEDLVKNQAFFLSSPGKRSGLYLGVFLCGIVFTAGFFPQALMFWRMQANPEINWGHHQGLGGFLDYVRRKEFGSAFLLSNPALIYNPVKNFNQIVMFLKTLLFEFGIILPLSGLLGIFLTKMKNRQEYLVVFFAFIAYTLLQIFLLSTIDPGGENNPFQLNKFYLVSFLFASTLAAVCINFVIEHFFSDFKAAFLVIISALLLIYTFVNWQKVSFRNNYFSRDTVLDALDEAPSGALLITVDHLMYFGTLYEQKVNGRYLDKTILYFPNEKNKDNEKYHQDVFNREENIEFKKQVESQYGLGVAESYILSVISKNLDRKILILQGDFEYNFFRYLKDFTHTNGLWLEVRKDQTRKSVEEIKGPFLNLRNKGFKKDNFFLKQQGFQASTYAISYYVAGLELAEIGDYKGAVEFFMRSLEIDPTKTTVENDIALVNEVLELNGKVEELVNTRDTMALTKLAEGLFTIKNYKDSASVYEYVINLDGGTAQAYNNAASAYAYIGNSVKAKAYYERALKLDPSLDVAKRGLEILGN